jgi:ABC-2 type transport system permease protein
MKKLIIKQIKQSFEVPKVRVFFLLVKKELQDFFFTPIFYIISVLFVLSVYFVFFGIFRFLEFGTSNLTPLFTSALLCFVFIVPALTMGSIAKERQQKTLELILTKPISIVSFVTAKWLSISIVIGILSIFLLPGTLFVNSLVALDLGQLTMQLVGLFIVGASIAGIGVAVSSFSKSEIPSFLITVVICAVLILSGSEFVRLLPFRFDWFLNVLGIFSHYSSLSRGVIDIRDVVYFFTLILLSLSIASFVLYSEKYPKNFTTRIISKLAVALIAVMFGIVSVYGQQIPGRIDLTENKIYTLSNVTQDILKNTDGELKIALYTSSNLPIQFQTELQAVKDILRDYQASANGKIKIDVLYTDRDEEAKEKAQSIGLREILFSVNSEDSTNRTLGYLGLGFDYQGSTEVLELTGDVTANLEFEITKTIMGLVNSEKPKIAFLNSGVARRRSVNYRILNKNLSEIYELSDINLESEKDLSNFDIVILTSPNQKFSEEAIERLRDYYENGGSIWLLSDPIEISEQTLIPVPNDFSMNDLFAKYGVIVEKNLIYDLDSNNQINLGSSLMPVVIDYPFWLKVLPTKESLNILNSETPVSILWGSSVKMEEKESGNVIVLLTTTTMANFQTSENVNITPNQKIDKKGDEKQFVMAVALENDNKGRAIVIGDSLFLTDGYITQSNLNFALSAVEWLTQGEYQLSSIVSKKRTPEPLEFEDSERKGMIFNSIILPVLSTAIIGIFVLGIRKKDL